MQGVPGLPRPPLGVAVGLGQLSPPSSACRLWGWPQEEVVVAGAGIWMRDPPWCQHPVSLHLTSPSLESPHPSGP